MLSALELRRQILHFVFGVLIATMLYFGVFTIYHLFAILVAGILMSQLCKRFRVPVASWVMDHFEREENRKTFPGRGPIFFMIGSILVVYFFPLDIALASIMILSVGDAVSHIAGKLLSKHTYRYIKSIEGTIAGASCAFVGALIFVDVSVALWGSILTMLVETINIGIDDNLFLPILAATIMTVL